MSKPKFLYTCYPDGNMRKIEILSYDGNKYCDIKYLDMKNLPKISTEQSYENGFASIKAGYIYRTKRKSSMRHSTLCRWFDNTP